MPRKIKIAQVITRMDWGGSPDLVRILCEHLDPEKYDITLISGPTAHPTARTEGFLKNFPGKYIRVSQLIRDIEPIHDIIAFIRLYILLRLNKFDIVHTHTAKAGALARYAAYLAGVKIIIHSPHGHNLYGYFKPALTRRIIKIERFVSRFTDRIIAATQLEKKDYLAHSIGTPSKIDVIYAGIDMKDDQHDPAHKAFEKKQLKASVGIPEHMNVVGMIGRLEHVKGPGYFVEAAMQIAKLRQDVCFVLIGDGSLKAELENKVRSQGLKERIIFTGWREDVDRMLTMLDVMVLPSLNEAVGLVLIEAQSHGIPVVASNVGGIPETIKENETGFLVQAGHADKLEQAILFLLDHPDKREAMGLAAKEWVKSRFKAQQMAQDISGLYDELLHAKNIF
jgi:glycosyltransferase involved in cell wall biosynthesis